MDLFGAFFRRNVLFLRYCFFQNNFWQTVSSYLNANDIKPRFDIEQEHTAPLIQGFGAYSQVAFLSAPIVLMLHHGSR